MVCFCQFVANDSRLLNGYGPTVEALVNVRRRMLAVTATYFGVLVTLIAVLGALGLRVRNASAESVEEIAPIQLAARQLRNAAVDMETGLRGYVLTGDPKFLEPHEHGRVAAKTQLASLDQLLKESTARERIAAVSRRLQEWQVEIADPQLVMVRSGDLEGAVRFVKSGKGRRSFDRVRSAIGDLDGLVDARVAANVRVVRETQNQLLAAAGLLGAVTLLLGLGFARSIKSWNDGDTANRERALDVENDELTWLAALNAKTDKLNRAETVASVARVLAEEAAVAFGATYWNLGILDRRGHLSIDQDPGLAPLNVLNGMAMAADATPLAAAVKTRRYVSFGAVDGLLPATEFGVFERSVKPVGVVSGVAVPLLSGFSHLRGAMTVMWSHPVTVDARLRSRLETVAVLCAETMRRAELLETVTAMASVSEALSEAITVDDVQEIVTARAWEPFGAAVSIMTMVAGNELRVVQHPGIDEAVTRRYDAVELAQSSPWTDAARTGVSTLIEDIAEYLRRYPQLLDEAMALGTEAEAAIPIEVGGRVIALVGLVWFHSIDAVAIRATAATFADIVSAALGRAGIYRSTMLVSQLATRLTSATTVSELTDAFFEFGLPVVGATTGQIATLDMDTQKDRVDLRQSTGDKSSSTGQERSLSILDSVPIVDAIRVGRPVTVQTTTESMSRYPLAKGESRPVDVVATVAIPMRSSSQNVIGAVGFIWDDERRIDLAGMALVETIAELCGQTLDRTRLVDQDHRLVTALASRLFGHHTAPPGMDVATRYVPSVLKQWVGGDWFEVIQLSDDRVAAVVGDVVGHGIEAAADMAQLKTLIGTLLRMGVDCNELFHQLGPLLENAQTHKVFGTAALVELKPFEGTLCVSTAGHPPLLIWRPGLGASLANGSRYPLLGVPVLGPAPGTVESFEPGSVVVAYTDGLVERRRECLDVGIERLRMALERFAHHSVEAIADALIDTAIDTDHSDDIALVVIRNTAGDAP